MIYNVKTIEYPDSVQVRTYSRPVTVSNKINISDNVTPRKKEVRERSQEQINHCITSSVNRTVNQIYMISRANKWEYFVTLTINPEILDSTDFNLISEKLNIWTNNIIVPELHKDKSKWHFHGLFSNIGKCPLPFPVKYALENSSMTM